MRFVILKLKDKAPQFNFSALHLIHDPQVGGSFSSLKGLPHVILSGERASVMRPSFLSHAVLLICIMNFFSWAGRIRN
jgi:hypothetical protein